MLLDKGISIDVFYGNHPMHVAVKNNKLEVVDLLLERGANVDARNDENMTPLHVAAINRNLLIAEELLKRGANPNSTIYDLQSHLYAKFDCKPAEDSNEGQTTESVPKTMTDVQHDSFDSAGCGKSKTRVKFRGTAIAFAIRNVDADMTKLLLSRGADVRGDPNLLGAAVNSGNLEIIGSLLKGNADVNAKNEDRETALHRAVVIANSEDVKTKIAKLLLGEGACVCSRNKDRLTPLHVAAQKGYADLVETLLGFHPNESPVGSSNDSWIAFSIARGGSNSMLKNKAAQLYARTASGETALHLASSRNHRVVVEILLKHGIDVNSRTIFGKTALDVAFERGCRQAFVSLLRYGSDVSVSQAGGTFEKNRPGCCVVKCHRGEFITSNRFCVESIEKHVIKMKIAGQPISAGNSKCLDSDSETLRSYRRECEAEVERMRGEKISRTISLCDFLHKDVKELAVYCRNGRTVQALESKDLGKKFPIYSEIVCHNFKRGQMRAFLLNVGLNSFSSWIEYSLPSEVVISYIFRCLENEHLENLIEACQFPRS